MFVVNQFVLNIASTTRICCYIDKGLRTIIRGSPDLSGCAV